MLGAIGAGVMSCQAIVTSVQEVVNFKLWKQYSLRRQQMAESLRGRWDCPWVSNVAPGLRALQDGFSYINLESMANEVLLLHGTEEEHVRDMMRQGFDERLNRRTLYGRGVYLSCDACKAAQYCGHGSSGCIVIARALSQGHVRATSGLQALIQA